MLRGTDICKDQGGMMFPIEKPGILYLKSENDFYFWKIKFFTNKYPLPSSSPPKLDVVFCWVCDHIFNIFSYYY